MNDERWVIDIGMDYGEGLYCFCPLDPDGDVIFDMNVISTKPPGRLVGVASLDSQEAAEAWMDENEETFLALRGDV